jgi:hypothetical protein
MSRPRTSPIRSRPATPSSFGNQFESTRRSPATIRFTTSRAKSSIEWVEYRSKQLPAPGDYSPKRPSTSGGAFSNARPKSDLDWTILRAKQTPAADAYNVSNGAFSGTSGGRFSTANPKSYLELEEYRSKSLPSPAEYKVCLVLLCLFCFVLIIFNLFDTYFLILILSAYPSFLFPFRCSFSFPFPFPFPFSLMLYIILIIVQPRLATPNTPCKFNESRPKSYLDWIVYFSKQLPSPNQYPVRGKTRWNCSSEVASGGRFTSSARPSFINDETMRVSDHPAPGDYNTTGYRSSVKKKVSRTYDSRMSLSDQIRSLDAMTR